MPTDMIEMFVAGEDVPNIFWIHADPAQICEDQFATCLGAAIDENMALRARNKDCGNPASADVPAIAENSEGRGCLVPLVPVFAAFRKRGAREVGRRQAWHRHGIRRGGRSTSGKQQRW